MSKNFRTAWLRQESILFLDGKTGARAELPVPGEALPNIPAHLRLRKSGPNPKECYSIPGRKVRDALHLPAIELLKYQWVFVVPADLQPSEEILFIDYGVGALGAKRVFLLDFPVVVGPAITGPHLSNYVSVTDSFRSVAITYYGAEDKSSLFLPYDGFGQAALDATLDQLCPLDRPPVYVDDLNGEGRWNNLGIPVGLEEALDHLHAATSQLKCL